MTKKIDKNIGMTVWALKDIDQNTKTIYEYGIGTYVGKQPYPGTGNPLVYKGQRNPKIELDNGKDIYGAECWWEPATKEDRQDLIDQGWKIVTLDPPADRDTKPDGPSVVIM